LINGLLNANQDIQKTSFSIIEYLIVNKTAQESIDLAMNTLLVPIQINQSLLATIQCSKPDLQSFSKTKTFAYCLTWMLIFEHFRGELSFDLRAEYSTILRNLDVTGMFLDFLMDNLGILGTQTIDLKLYSVQEFYIEAFDLEASDSVNIFCAHLYYKSLDLIPGLVRLWYTASTVRQLVLGVESITVQHYSPILIKKELTKVQGLVDEDMKIRVNFNTFEINAGYVIDDAELDLAIKIPSCFPLKLIDISSGTAGGKQAGISEPRWRAWLLSVSSIIVGQNANISDALILFKKNVKLHFDGIEDCAICYAVISVVDRSTPQKTCKTCKHVFHGSCLYKV
jgi:hypothetical protein